MSVDPIADQFAFVSPFNYAENRPINGIDLWRLQFVDVNTGESGSIDVLNSTSTESELYDVNGNGTRDYYLPAVTVTPTSSTETSSSDAGTEQVGRTALGHIRMADWEARGSLDYNSALGSSSTLYGASFTLAAELHYYPDIFGTWLGKNGKLYNTSWGGNQYTGGKLKYAKDMSSNLKVGANMLSVVAYGTIGLDYYSALKEAGGYLGHSKTLTTAADATVNTAGVINPDGAFFAAGWEIGRGVTYTNAYQNFKHNYVLKTQGGRDGLMSTDK